MAGRRLRIQRLRLDQLVERFVFYLSIYIRLMFLRQVKEKKEGKGKKASSEVQLEESNHGSVSEKVAGKKPVKSSSRVSNTFPTSSKNLF